MLECGLQEEGSAIPKPDFTTVFSANKFGKEAVSVRHSDKKARSGCFLLYKYLESYTFPKKAIENAVCFHD